MFLYSDFSVKVKKGGKKKERKKGRKRRKKEEKKREEKRKGKKDESLSRTLDFKQISGQTVGDTGSGKGKHL